MDGEKEVEGEANIEASKHFTGVINPQGTNPPHPTPLWKFNLGMGWGIPSLSLIIRIQLCGDLHVVVMKPSDKVSSLPIRTTPIPTPPLLSHTTALKPPTPTPSPYPSPLPIVKGEPGGGSVWTLTKDSIYYRIFALTLISICQLFRQMTSSATLRPAIAHCCSSGKKFSQRCSWLPT